MLKISVTLTLIPSAIAAVMAGSPSLVAGILISTFERSTADQRARAEAMVPSVSLARSGSTSIETRPSALSSPASGAKMSQALRTSSVVTSKITRSTDSPLSTSWATCSSYRSPLAMAAAKIVGLVVTPTTALSLIRSARLPVSMRSRDRSSSQIDTPASASFFKRSLMVRSSLGRLWGTRVDVRSDGGRQDRVVRRGDDGLCRHTELLVDPGEVGRGGVVVDRDDPAAVADVLAPALLHAGLDRDARLDDGRDHAVAVGLVLVLEPLHARHRHDPGLDALLGELGACLDGQLDLGPGGDQHHVGRAALGVEQHVATAVHVAGLREAFLATREDRHVLPGQRERGRPVGVG